MSGVHNLEYIGSTEPPFALSTYLGAATSTGGSPVSYSSISVGAGFAGRKLVVFVVGAWSARPAVTCNGNAPSFLAEVGTTGSGGNTSRVQAFIIDDETSTSVSIVATGSLNSNRSGVYVFELSRLISTTPRDTKSASISSSSGSISTTVNRLRGAVTICAVHDAAGSSNTTHTWSGAAEDADNVITASSVMSAASAAAPTADDTLGITATFSSNKTSGNLLALVFR